MNRNDPLEDISGTELAIGIVDGIGPGGGAPPTARDAARAPVTSGPGVAPGAAGTPSRIPQPTTVAGGPVPPPPTMRSVQVLPPEELPDYWPPLPTANCARGDADGNLWIRTVSPEPRPGGLA